MPHKFWTVRPRIEDGEGNNTVEIPAMPGGAQYRTIVPGDLMVAWGGPSGSEHDHCIIGGNFGAPNRDYPGHYHWFIRLPDQTIEQATIGAAHHSHISALDPIGRVLPRYYLLMVTCDDVAYQTFIDDGWLEFGERPFDEETGEFGPMDQTAWSAELRTAAEDKVFNALGLELPSAIQNDKTLVIWLLDVGAFRYEEETKHE